MRFSTTETYLQSISTEKGRSRESLALDSLRRKYSEEIILDSLNFLFQFGCPPYGKKQTYPLSYLKENFHLLDAVNFEIDRNTKEARIRNVNELAFDPKSPEAEA